MPYHIDALSNAITAWYIGTDGTPVASEHGVLATEAQHGNIGWFVDSPRGPISQYPPGAALAVAPLYALTQPEAPLAAIGGTNRDVPPVEIPRPPLWQATLSSVLIAAGAAAALSVVFYRMGSRPQTAIIAGLVFGLATGAWSVASAMSWTHGPGMLAIAVALLFAQGSRWALAGMAMGAAILVRPHLAIVAALIGIGCSISYRNIRPVLRLGVPAAGGLGAIIAYNYWVWGTITISGGYGDAFTDRFLTSDIVLYLQNIVGSLFDLRHGLLIWAPFVAILTIGAFLARREVPPWASWAAIGGALYLLVQLRANRFSGGSGHFGYRYPLEALTAAAPLLYAGYMEWVHERSLARKLVVAGIAVGCLGQVMGAVFDIRLTG